METLELNVPKIFEFSDYQIIWELNKNLQRLNKKLRVIELDLQRLGFEFEGTYLGLVCVGKSPTDHQIIEMLNSKGQTRLTVETYIPKELVRRNRR